jgi:hypothetical protein
VRDRWRLPEDIPPGLYDLHLIIRDPSGYRDPLALAISGRMSDGSYRMDNLVVQAPE